MKKTPLYDIHQSHGAKFGPFAGYEMPLFYKTGIIAEHLHTRKKAGLFDISHMLPVDISGNGAKDLLSRLCPVDAESMNRGEAKYTFFLNEEAGIIDDLIVSKLSDDRFWLVCNAGCAQKDLAHIKNIAGEFDVEIKVPEYGIVALQGPLAQQVLSDFGLQLSDMTFMQTRQGEGEYEGWLISRSGYTGEDGFEIAMASTHIADFAKQLLDDERVAPIGLGARDSLRLEAGLSLYGQDLSDTITPMEAGLTWAIARELRQGGVYIGAGAVAQHIANKRKRKRVGLIPDGRAPVRAGAIISDGSEKQVGTVTSGGFGPSVGHPVALGLIAVNADSDTLVAQVRSKSIPLQIAPLPFTPHHYKR